MTSTRAVIEVNPRTLTASNLTTMKPWPVLMQRSVNAMVTEMTATHTRSLKQAAEDEAAVPATAEKIRILTGVGAIALRQPMASDMTANHTVVASIGAGSTPHDTKTKRSLEAETKSMQIEPAQALQMTRNGPVDTAGAIETLTGTATRTSTETKSEAIAHTGIATTIPPAAGTETEIGIASVTRIKTATATETGIAEIAKTATETETGTVTAKGKADTEAAAEDTQPTAALRQRMTPAQPRTRTL